MSGRQGLLFPYPIWGEITHAKNIWTNLGGKAKPLKAPKKEKKEDDEEDKVHTCLPLIPRAEIRHGS